MLHATNKFTQDLSDQYFTPKPEAYNFNEDNNDRQPLEKIDQSNQIENEIQKFNSVISKLTEEKNFYFKKLQISNQSIEELITIQNELKAQNNELQEEIKQLKKENEILLQKKQEEQEKSESEINEYEIRLNELKTQNNELQEEVNQLKKENVIQISQANNIKEEINQITQKIDEKNDMINQYEKQNVKTTSDQLKINKLAQELINGRPVNQIPDKYLSRVHIELSCIKERAMKEGLINRIQMIQKAMINVERYEKKRAKFKSRTMNSFSNVNLNDENDEIKAFLPKATLDSNHRLNLIDGKSFEIAETCYIPLLIERCKERINEYLQNGKYSTAQKFENVHVKLVPLIGNRQTERKNESKVNYLADQLNKNQKKLKEIEEEKKIKLDEHEQKVKESLTKLQNEYEQLNKEYDEITNGPIPVSAKKFSQDYLNTREKERFLIQSRRYKKASTIKEIADKMEEKELQSSCVDFIEKREKKKKVIEEKQNKALNCIIENGERAKMKIINEFDSKISEIQRTIENIQYKLNDSNALTSQFSNSSQEIGIKKNTSKVSSAVATKKTVKSKCRSSFVTQKTPHITSTSRTNLNIKEKKIK